MKKQKPFVALVAAVLLASTVVVGTTVGSAAASAASTGATGSGRSASSSVVNLGQEAKQPGAAVQTAPQHLAPHEAGGSTLPSRPTVGSRPMPGGSHATTAAAGADQSGSAVEPLVAPAVQENFDGINEATGCSSCEPPDPIAASSGTEITELVNTFIQIQNDSDTVLCGGITLNHLLRTTDELTDPRIVFDDVNQRFALTVTVVPASTTATPALWIAASTTADACGFWNINRLTFNGSDFPAGTELDFPMLGQDTNALLFSTRNITPSSGTNFTVFGVPKSAIYSGSSISFSVFNVASLTAPVVNAGEPMISSPFSYFLAAVPGTGYRLYRLSNSGGPGASITLQATISSPFNAPSRRANQPNTTATLDPSDGNILYPPSYDGTSIWFAHDFDLGGFPTIRYGAVDVANNTVTIAEAFHSSTSDDFNASIGVGMGPSGDTVYLDWSYTDAPAGVSASDTVDTVPPGGGVPNLIASGAVLVNGSNTTQDRFGDISSAAIDPSVLGGGCAVTAQQYFAADGTWNTRLARVGTCQSAAVPNVQGEPEGEAIADVDAAGLVALTQNEVDRTCTQIGDVLDQSPAAGTVVAPGTTVTLSIGVRPAPPAQCE